MGLRRADEKVDLAPPPWYPGCISVSVVLHLGGKCVHVPAATYVGGKVAIYDHVSTKLIDYWTLGYLLKQEGVSEDGVDYYLKIGDTFQLIEDEKKLQDAASNSIRQRLFHIYVAQSESTSDLESGTGTSNGSSSESGGERGTGVGGDGYGDDNTTEAAIEGYMEENGYGLHGIVDAAGLGEGIVGYNTIHDAEQHLEGVLEDYIEGEDIEQEGIVVEDDFFLESEYVEQEDWEEILDAYHDEEDNLKIGLGSSGVDAVGSLTDGGYVNSSKGKELAVIEEGDSSDGDMVTAEDDFDERRISDEENEDGRPAPVFNPSEIYKPAITLEMLFGTRDEFKKAVQSLAIMEQRQVKFTRTTPTRVYAKCMAKDCRWKICAHKVHDAESLQVTSFFSKHTCMETHDVPAINSTWLAERFQHKFVSDPKRSVEGFRLDVIKKLKVNVTKHQAYAAKKRALQTLNGSSEYQFSRLWDYAEELRSRNPGSTIIVGTKDDANHTRFDRFYACFAALKRGWRLGCRPLIGIDGCHLSGPHKGILLTAVGVDPNNQLYPIAYAIVPIENRDNWGWFLHVLKNDHQLDNVRYLTFVSDRQKGLIQAMQEVLPNVDHRFCVRHLHNNFCTAGYRGLALKNLMWKAARAGTVPEFMYAMKKIKDYSEGAWKWLCEKPPTQWSKSHFSEGPMCDMLLNNLCESFNSCIKEARDKTILTSLEWIREYIMKRHSDNRDRATHKWNNKLICPRIEKILQKTALNVGNCIPIKASDRLYQIRMMEGEGQFVLDLVKRSCSCRLWQLNGYPCLHAMAAINKQGNDPLHYVEKCYTVSTYVKAYQHPVCGVSSDMFWHQTAFIPPCPPNFGRGVGRPPKSRKLSADEPKKKKRPRRRQTTDPSKMTRRGTTSHCSICGEEGHHVTICERRRIAKLKTQQGPLAAETSSGGTSQTMVPDAAPNVSQVKSATKIAIPESSTGKHAKGKKQKKKSPVQPTRGNVATSSTKPSLLPPNPETHHEPDETFEEPVITQDHLMIAPPMVPGPSIDQQIRGKGPASARPSAASKGGSWRPPLFRVDGKGPPIHNLRSRKESGSGK